MKRWLPTIAGLLLLAGLGFWVVKYETGSKAGENKTCIYKVEQSDIVRFRLENAEKGVTIECGKQKDGTWWITAPERLETETDAVESVVRHLASPEVERDLGPQTELTPFQLDKPSCKAVFFTKDGGSRTLLIGSKNPADTAYFVKESDGKNVYTVAAWSADNMRKAVSDLRSKSLLAFDPAAVTRLVLKRPKGGKVEMARDGTDGGWRMTAPAEVPADRYAVDGILNDLKNLKGTEVIEEPLAWSRYKLDQPTVVVTVFTRTGTPQEVTLSRPDLKKEEAFASSSRLPFVFKLGSAYVLNGLLKGVDEYRERLLLSLNREDVSEMTLTQGALKVVCGKDSGGKWAVKEPPARTAMADEINELLFEVVYVRAEKFVDDAPKVPAKYGLDPPRVSVLLKGTKDGKPTTSRYYLGNRIGENAFYKSDDRPAVCEVRKAILEKVERFVDQVRAGPAAKTAGTAGSRK